MKKMRRTLTMILVLAMFLSIALPAGRIYADAENEEEIVEEIVEDIKAQQRYMFDTKSAQDERTIKRLWITILVIFFALLSPRV